MKPCFAANSSITRVCFLRSAASGAQMRFNSRDRDQRDVQEAIAPETSNLAQRRTAHGTIAVAQRSASTMKTSARVATVRRCDLTRTRNAMRELEDYCASHPGSPAAVRRPVILIRGGTCVALLGRSVEEGIVGLGSTVSGALRAFDVQYLRALRPPD